MSRLANRISAHYKCQDGSVKCPGQVPGVIVPSPSSNLSREAID